MNVRHTMVGEMSSCGNAVVGKCSVRKVSPEGKSQVREVSVEEEFFEENII